MIHPSRHPKSAAQICNDYFYHTNNRTGTTNIKNTKNVVSSYNFIYLRIIMKLKEINKDIYDVSTLLDEELGAMGTAERQKNTEKAWEEYNAQILLDARKNAGLTQAELAERIGAEKGYISRIERGLIVPSVSTLYRIASAMGLTVELRPM